MSENIMNNNINIKPNKNWSAYEIVVKTGYNPNNIQLTYNEHIQEHNPNKQFVIRAGNAPTFFYFEDKGEYLGLYVFKAKGDWNTYYNPDTYRRADEEYAHFYQSTVAERGDKYRRVYYLPTDRLGTNPCTYDITPKFEETRIYKDRKFVTIGYCEVESIVKSNQTEHPRPVSTEGYFVNFKRDDDGKMLTEIHTDEEARKFARKFTKKHFKEEFELFNRNGADKTDIYDMNCSYYWDMSMCRLSQKHKDVLLKFFGKDCGSTFYNFGDLYSFLVQPPVQAKDPKEGKEEHGYELLEFIEPGNNRPQGISTDEKDKIKHIYTRWGRLNDEIVLCQRAFDDSSKDYIFTYNVKTKKRFYGEYDHDYRSWAFPIPSYQLITQRFYLNIGEWREYYWYSSSKYTTVVHQEILGNISVQELFKGSNVEVLIQHGDVKALVSYDARQYRYGSREPRYIRDIINDQYINSIVFGVIFSTGVPVLEQMLKSGLYNLYLKELEYQMGAGRNDVGWLWDKNKSTSNVSSWSYRENVQMIYNSKGKNLKEMFGLTMNQLRIIDQASVLVEVPPEKDSRDTHTNGYRQKLYLADADTFYGVSLNNLDEKTFRTILETAKKRCHISGVGEVPGYENTYVALCDRLSDKVKDKINAMPLQSKIKAAKLFLTAASDVVRDYLNMRQKLQEIQEKKLDIEGIWDEKRYPIIPEPAVKFIPFREGVTDRLTHGSRPVDLFEYSVYGDISVYFKDETYIDAPKASYVTYDMTNQYRCELMKHGGEVIGALVRMDPMGHLKFLHDDISYWVRFYQNAEKDKDFREAVKRVQPLAWKDEKSGLEIIAPEHVGDLTREGEVLAHCVASYADAIIEGSENIMFLRRSDMISQPYFTVEVLNDGQIRQVHCYRNGSLTAEAQAQAFASSGQEVYNKTYDIVGFLTKWAKAMKGKVKADTIKSSYGALCAIRNRNA